MVMMDNVATSYFQTQKKLSPKQARWQDFLVESDFRLEYQPGRVNVVVDALSRKAELAPVVASMLRSDFIEQIKEGMQQDKLVKDLLKLAKEGKTRRFWEKEGTLLTLGNWLFVPMWENLQKEILKECHDSLWAGHSGINRTFALVQDKYYWPKMQNDVKAYVQTCLVCQQDKVEQQHPADLLEPLLIAEKP